MDTVPRRGTVERLPHHRLRSTREPPVRAGTRGLVDHIDQRGHLRAGLAPERGGSIFAAVTHPAVWRSLRFEHGWALDEIEDWMADTLAAQLLAHT